MKKVILTYIFSALIFSPVLFAENIPALIEYIPNKGQWHPNILYKADLKSGKVYLEDQGMTFYFFHPDDVSKVHPQPGSSRPDFIRAHAVKTTFLNAHSKSRILESEIESFPRNYFLGKDRSKWAANVHACHGVKYENLYDHISLKVYSDYRNLKYDFIVAPNGKPSVIQIQYEGCDKMELENGNLKITTSVGAYSELAPVAWQVKNGIKEFVNCKFRLTGSILTFEFPEGYDESLELVIDPTLVFSSYSGSTADNWGFTASFDTSGNAIAGGNVNDVGYPVTSGAYQLIYAGPAPPGLGQGNGNTWACDMAIAKYNPAGTSLLFATYLGGSDNEEPHSIVVDGNGDIIILGITFSTDYPVTSLAFDTSYNGEGDIVISKLSSDGTSLLGSTYIGSDSSDGTNISYNFNTQYSLKFSYGDESRGDIIVDSSNNYIVACVTKSPLFPHTAGAFQTTLGGGLQDGVVFKMSSTLSSMQWGTFLGGNGDDACYSVKQDATKNIFVSGGTTSTNFPVTAGAYQSTYQGGPADGFIARFDSSGTSLIRCTYVGTSHYDQTFFVDLDNNSNVYVSGQTMSPNFPISPGVYSDSGSAQFIQKFDTTLSSPPIFSTVVGSRDSVPDIALTAFLVDVCQNIYLAGWGRCINYGTVYPGGSTKNLPVTTNAFQKTTDSCDFYFLILGPDADSLLYATYFGGNLSGEHVDGGTSRFDKRGVIYESICAGCGFGNDDLPTTPGAVSSTNNSNNCNNAIVKFDLNISGAYADAQALPSTSGCVPYTVQFDGQVNAATNNYYWDFGDGSPTDTALNPVHIYQDTGTFRAVLYAFGTCKSDSIVLIITVDSLPTADFTYSLLPCDSLVHFTNNSVNAISYVWNFGDSTIDSTAVSPDHVYSLPGAYQVTLSAYRHNCRSDTTLLISVNSFSSSDFSMLNQRCDTTVQFTNHSLNFDSLHWNFGDGAFDYSALNPVHSYSAPGNYLVTLTTFQDTCHTDFTVAVTIDTIPAAAFSYSKDTCYPGVYFTNLSLQANAFTWDFGDGSIDSIIVNPYHIYSLPGLYTVQLNAYHDSCISSSSLIVQVDSFPRSNFSVIQQACDSIVQFLNASLSYDSLHWNFGDGVIDYLSANPVHTYSMPGFYQATLSTFQDTCRSDTTIAIVIDTIPIASFTYQKDTCDPEVHFINLSAHSALYNWDFGDGSVDSTIANPVHTYSMYGSDTVRLTVRNGSCTSDTFLTLFIDTMYTASFSYEKKACDPEVTFTNNSINSTSYIWNFGDGDTSGAQHPIHIYDSTKLYTVTLIANPSSACPDTISQAVNYSTQDTTDIFIPNVFTPNNDSRNELFEITGLGDCHPFKLKIYNRWGKKVFETDSGEKFWDGKINNVDAEEGVYYFILTSDAGDYHGSVSLLR